MPPNANPQIIDFVTRYCSQNLKKYNFIALYLIGSRAYGNPRPNSDHDFIAIVSDDAPADVITGGQLHSKIYIEFNIARTQAQLGAVDLLI